MRMYNWGLPSKRGCTQCGHVFLGFGSDDWCRDCLDKAEGRINSGVLTEGLENLRIVAIDSGKLNLVLNGSEQEHVETFDVLDARLMGVSVDEEPFHVKDEEDDSLLEGIVAEEGMYQESLREAL